MGRSAREELIQLMLVCRAWRNAALLTHQLWSTVLIDRADAQRWSFDKVAIWLRHAGDMPRTLVISPDRVEDCGCQCDALFASCSPCILDNPALGRLLLEGPSLHTLAISVTHKGCMENFTRELATRTVHNDHRGSIESLYLVVRHWKARHVTLPSLDCFPSLVRVQLGSSFDVSELSGTVGSFKRLTFLTVDFGRGDVSPTATLAELSKCECLEQLILTIHTDFSCPVESGPVVYLPRLKVFRLREALRSPLKCIYILNHLHFPALATLNATDMRESSIAPAWKNFFQRHTGIKVFKCYGSNGAPLQAAFNHLPSLNRLSIGGDTTAVAWFMSRLRRSLLQNEYWLPLLEHIELLDVEQKINLQYLFDFLLSRSHRQDEEREGILEVARMKSATIEFYARKHAPSLVGRVEQLMHSSEVRSLKKNGMQVMVSSYRGAG